MGALPRDGEQQVSSRHSRNGTLGDRHLTVSKQDGGQNQVTAWAAGFQALGQSSNKNLQGAEAS